jgi:oligoribonuclease NrnB/cAMP/cGMP phosphodiesterase (DHH superfamily)
MSDQNKIDVCIHHFPCRDGLAAAWIVKKAFPEVELVPANYGQKPPDVTGKHVLIVDFSYPRDVLLEMREKAASLLVLDHHQTAKQNLEGLDFCVFDMARSGARMAFDHLNHVPNVFKRSELINYIQDRDLWQWKMPSSKEVSAVIDSYPLTLESLDKLDTQINYYYDQMIEEGEGILRYQNKLIEQLCENKRLVRWPIDGGFEVYAVNTSVLQSEVANQISDGKPFGIAWYQSQDGMYNYSLRSKPEQSNFDVSNIVKPLGGGGHRNAAGLRSKEKLL